MEITESGSVTETVRPDGDIVATVERLAAAVHGFASPLTAWMGGRVRTAPSLYEQLLQAIPAGRGESFSRPQGMAGVPVWPKALDLRTDIDAAVGGWCPGRGSVPERLRQLASARWRPQDAEVVERYCADLERWAGAVRALLDPDPVLAVSAACPQCGADVARVKRDGEWVRQAALQVVVGTGCKCLLCGAFWAPDKYLMLMAELGLSMPEGVLE